MYQGQKQDEGHQPQVRYQGPPKAVLNNSRKKFKKKKEAQTCRGKKKASRIGKQSVNGQGTFLRKLRATAEINAKIEKPSLSQDVGRRQSPNQTLLE